MSRPEIKLAWVLVADQLQPVASFRGIKPLPLVFCPHCREQVTLRANGAIRQSYAAHRPASACPATRSESALHQNAKFYLARQLQTTTTIKIAEPCVGVRADNPNTPSEPCSAIRVRQSVQTWDTVRIEYTLEPLRPDLVLLRNGHPVAAIEVLVTHRVDEEKAAVYNQLGVPWVEVKADMGLYTPPTAWTPANPLKAIRHSRPWRCAKCEAELRAIERDRLEHEREKQQALFWQRFKPDHFRVVDVYYPSGERYRAVFHVGDLLNEAGQTEARCLTVDRDVLAKIAPDAPNRKKQLQAAYDERERMFRENSHALLDCAMVEKWFPCNFVRFISRDDPLWPQRKFWVRNSEKSYWDTPKQAGNTRWFPDDRHAERLNQAGFSADYSNVAERTTINVAAPQIEAQLQSHLECAWANLDDAETLLTAQNWEAATQQLQVTAREVQTLIDLAPDDWRVISLRRQYYVVLATLPSDTSNPA